MNRQPRLLPQSDGNLAMCFSPDSQWLAFTSRGELHRVSVSGGTPISICEVPTPRGIAWVDATTIVYTPTISSGLMWVDVTNGETQELTSIDTSRGERSHRWPTVVPGQRAVVFECQYLGRDYDESDIQWVSLDGGEPRTIHRGGAAPLVVQGLMLFVRDNSLFAVHFDADKVESSGLPIPVRENIVSSVGNQEDDDGSAQYSLDAQGNLLYMDTRGVGRPNSRLAWFDIETGVVSPFGPSGQHNEFMLSPDTKLVVVSRHRDGDDNLYVYDLETGNESMLTFRPSVEYIGAWSPDSRVFYWSQSSNSGDRFEVWRRPVDGSAQPEFVVASPTQAGVWPMDVSPDGRYLAVAAWRGSSRRDLLILDLQDVDAGFTEMAPNERDTGAFQWFTPDIVIYQESRGEGGSVLMRRFPDDGALWSFPDTDAGYWAGFPVASRDAAILFGPEGVYRFPVAIDDGRVRLGNRETLHIWTMEEYERMVWAEPHPDGKRMLLFYADDPGESESKRLPSRTAIGAGSPDLVLVTGWLQVIQNNLEQSNR
jgi:Tol biopolymer transport system component